MCRCTEGLVSKRRLSCLSGIWCLLLGLIVGHWKLSGLNHGHHTGRGHTACTYCAADRRILGEGPREGHFPKSTWTQGGQRSARETVVDRTWE